MKSVFRVALVATLLAGTEGKAQEPEATTVIKSYRFDAAVPVQPCSWDGRAVTGQQAENVPTGSRFNVLKEVGMGGVAGVDGPRVLVQFLKWIGKDSTALNDRYYYARSTSVAAAEGASKSVGYFCVNKNDVETLATRTYATGWASRTLTSGLLLLPIKVRPAGSGRAFDFSRDITLGTVAGPRIRVGPTEPMYVDMLFGAGITATRLDSGSTDGVVRTATDRAAFTWTVGLMFEAHSFQIGLHTGADYISNPSQKAWVYQGKPWIAIGLGYNLLSAAPKPSTTNEKR